MQPTIEFRRLRGVSWGIFRKYVGHRAIKENINRFGTAMNEEMLFASNSA